MPVFKAGVNYGKVVAAGLGVPFFEFSHQEGHLEAVRRHSSLNGESEYLAYHLSGGTCELLHVKNGTFSILGGSKDLSFGQVIDRVGVAMGMEFPAGKKMDLIAVDFRDKRGADGRTILKTGALLKKIPIDGYEINLSGIETQCQRELQKDTDPEALIYELFQNISVCLCKLTETAALQTGCGRILFTGGVSASLFVRDEIRRYFGGKASIDGKPLQIVFGDPALSSDNAVGVAFLGGNELWQSNQ
jgi:N6-L-threonylcarbamoyladenine synthase